MNSSVTKIPCKLTRFFKYWLQFTAPLHKLTEKDMNILSHLLIKRYELSKVITDDDVIDSYLFSRDIKTQIIEESGETRTNFSVTLSRLRKQNVILPGNKINKKFIPHISKNVDKFDLILIFDIQDDTK